MDKTESVARAKAAWGGRVHGVYPKSCAACAYSERCKQLKTKGPLKDTTKCRRLRRIEHDTSAWYRTLPQHQAHLEPLVRLAVQALFMIVRLAKVVSKHPATWDRRGELVSQEAGRELRRWTALLLRLHAAMGLTCRAASELGAAVAEGMSLAEALREADELAARVDQGVEDHEVGLLGKGRRAELPHRQSA